MSSPTNLRSIRSVFCEQMCGNYSNNPRSKNDRNAAERDQKSIGPEESHNESIRHIKLNPTNRLSANARQRLKVRRTNQWTGGPGNSLCPLPNSTDEGQEFTSDLGNDLVPPTNGQTDARTERTYFARHPSLLAADNDSMLVQVMAWYRQYPNQW